MHWMRRAAQYKEHCNRQSVGLIGPVISPSQGCYLKRIHKHRKKMKTHTYKPQMGFEPMTPAFERAMTVHLLDCSWI
jgi:hypothetical protein